MESIGTDATFKYTQALTLLYIDDDLDVQTQTRELFEVLFLSVECANDGVEALAKYEKNHYDLIISDIKMPNMDGITLTKEIKKINADQSIIIASAYDDKEYLLDFINLGIKYFLQKPMEQENILKVLYSVAKDIVNEKMIETYRKELESKNIELKNKNDELQSLVRILDSKLMQVPQESPMQKDIDISTLTVDENDLKELMELEHDISGAAVLINLSNNLSISNIQVLGKMFLDYANILTIYSNYEPLTSKMQHLGNSLTHAPTSFIERVEDISILLESFIYVLKMWRVNLVNKDIKKAFELHPSMINDINTIIIIIDDKEDEIKTEMEFF